MITLNHTIVPVLDNVESARFYEKILGFTFVREWGKFAIIQINEHLTFDFMNSENFPSLHYAFKVNDAQFDEIFQRIKDANLSYGSEPGDPENGVINYNHGGRGVYFKDINGHLLEILTADYIFD